MTTLNIAVLITVFNRIDITRRCLESLSKQKNSFKHKVDVFLVDDNSPDNTGGLIKNEFPEVNVYFGTGSLYWAGGMRLAWDMASDKLPYDFYIWLNDDVELFPNAFNQLFNDYYRTIGAINTDCMILGATCDCKMNPTYTTMKKGVKIIPNGEMIKTDELLGNLVLVSSNIFFEVGDLDNSYIHGIADTDYGLRANQKGFPIFLSSSYLGICELNNKVQWYDKQVDFRTRFKLLFSVTGGNYFQYLKFKRKHFGIKGFILSMMKTFFRLFFPGLFK